MPRRMLKKQWLLLLVSLVAAAMLFGCASKQAGTGGNDSQDTPDDFESGETRYGPILFVEPSNGKPTSAIRGQGYMEDGEDKFGMWGYSGYSSYYGKSLFKGVQFYDGEQYIYLPSGTDDPYDAARISSFVPEGLFQSDYSDRIGVIGGASLKDELMRMAFLELITDPEMLYESVQYYEPDDVEGNPIAGFAHGRGSFPHDYSQNVSVGYGITLDRGPAFGGVDAVMVPRYVASDDPWTHLPGEGNDYGVDVAKGEDGIFAMVGYTTSSTLGPFTRNSDTSTHNADHFIATFDGSQLVSTQVRGEDGYNHYPVAVTQIDMGDDGIYFCSLVQRVSNTDSDIMLHMYKFDTNGAWSHHWWHALQGGGWDEPSDIIAVGSDLYIVGTTNSVDGDYSARGGDYDDDLDAFVMKVVFELDEDKWLTYLHGLHGNEDDAASSIYYDEDKDMFHVCGTTKSDDHDYDDNPNDGGVSTAFKAEIPRKDVD